MRLRWTPEAAVDLERIALYLRVNHPEWRVSTTLQIYRQLQSLRRNPYIGRPSEEGEGIRELPLAPLPYLVKYHVDEYAITVLQIWHGAQDSP